MMALTPKELNSLLSVVSEENTSLTFDALTSQLHHYFSKADQYKVACALVLLLQQPDLLIKPTQKLTAVVLLYELYRGDSLATNPFSYVFLHLLNPPPENVTGTNKKLEYAGQLLRLSSAEKGFLAQLISTPQKDLLKKTPKQILLSDPASYQPIDVSSLQAAVSARQAEIPFTGKAGMPVVLPDPDPRPLQAGSVSAYPESKTTTEALLTGDNAVVQQCYTPEFLRLVPPLHVCEDELVWLNPMNPSQHKVSYDPSICAFQTGSAEAKRLIGRAFKETLTLQQRQHLLSALAKDPQLVYNIGLTPSKLPDLVENNPLTAVEILLKLMESSHITEFFSVLVNMELSLHSMEVVSRLTTSVELPTEFVHLYISNCISTCETIKDRYMQNRLVRLVCVFLQSLIRNKIIDVKALFCQVCAFCVEFSRIREASALYRLLKQLDHEDSSLGASGDNKFNAKGETGKDAPSPSS